MNLNFFVLNRSIKGVNSPIVNDLDYSSTQQYVSRLNIPMKKSFIEILAEQSYDQLFRKVQYIQHCKTVLSVKYIMNALPMVIGINGLNDTFISFNIEVKVA
jgi:hypothetical protein